MDITLKYGHSKKTLVFPDQAEVDVLEPTSLPLIEDLAEAMDGALDRPLQLPRLEERAAPASVSIAVPDETRPFPTKTLLPLLLARLHRAYPSLRPEDVTIVVGGGLHPPHDREALERILPEEVLADYTVVPHDAKRAPMTDYGNTSRGTPVFVNKAFADGDMKIVMGLLDPHQFAGFTGGAKGMAVGCAGAKTIQGNHALMFHEKAQAGVREGNPVREDLNEMGRMAGVYLAVNVVLDKNKQVVGLWAGNPEAVLAAGAEVCASVYGVTIEHQYDIVIASCGGHPKDICLYQAQKGLNLSSRAAEPGGKILLLASCGQGIGDEDYFEYVCRFDEPVEVFEDFKQNGFRMGAHKAFLFSRTLNAFEVAVATELDQSVLGSCMMTKADPQERIDSWLKSFEGRVRVGVVPNANATYFTLASGGGSGE
ncbi:nickel-dependent lactate racemase [Oceanidesulfovibrio marinus]|uniref:Nickel-dependent lactate racemase n=1 Tax=Oceanidesulfovibrio marinus TaxID=370038 RepID=A0A6P1ZLZ9_9BACT|nr:nickel-dependent lactate racemase [Oceanidesulfovibrio marinus]QJT08759.1 nickel-dependent lactate racemase [Oceanidesulfovibrio marinus]TVM36813.1 nickel-dependent lactate racemase [Oceanidesulfovibrio marinus]